ncbi:MAG: AAA family ATPase [Clostridiales bacterium]|nr:AAA family ATPase [Clostridiales bacterium]
MNIKEAKEQVKQTVISYLERDEYGNKVIPIGKQRPIFIVGAPGLGKTDIMAQVANELDIGLVEYSLTHHTRQSALGLPVISEKTYDGNTYKVSEYTMSEIISSVYELIETTKNKKGILFIDEINCVSETLQPIMLQFLQHKMFGKHKVPEDFVVVSAGNPTEFNDSARDFDSVILDRVKKITVTPDFDVWKEYAYSVNAHQAIISFLDANRQDFYVVEKDVHGDSIVTARGWIDLSNVIKVYEMKGFEVTQELVVQYIQNKKIAVEFFDYYSLYMKYNEKFRVGNIIDGKYDDAFVKAVESAPFDERMAVIALIHSALRSKSKKVFENKLFFDAIVPRIRAIATMKSNVSSEIESQKALITQEYTQKCLAGNCSALDSILYPMMEKFFSELSKKNITTSAEVSKALTEAYAEFVSESKHVAKNFDFALKFIESAYKEGEITVLLDEITIDKFTSFILQNFEVKEYAKHASKVLNSTKIDEITKLIDSLDIRE